MLYYVYTIIYTTIHCLLGHTEAHTHTHRPFWHAMGYYYMNEIYAAPKQHKHKSKLHIKISAIYTIARSVRKIYM